MNVQFPQRLVSLLMVVMMLFTMNPMYVIAESEHDHDHETTAVLADNAVTVAAVAELAVSASASATFVYAGEGPVAVSAKISGGVAPYEVTLQAVKDGSVVSTSKVTTESSSASLSFAPVSYGDYELVVLVHDAAHAEVLTSVSLAVAEHDKESSDKWAASVAGAAVSGNWGTSLVSVAKTQIGYAESAKDFTVNNGQKQGYSRYGAWYGAPYSAWNAAFLAFVAEYANVPTDALLAGYGYRSWVNGLSSKNAYEKTGSGYAPKAGDIAFLSGSRVAIVESVSGNTVNVIEGDVDGKVARKQYAMDKVVGFGNTALMQGLYEGTATAVPTATPVATPVPDDMPTKAPTATPKPTATPVPEIEGEMEFVATPVPGPGVTVAPKDDLDILDMMTGNMGETVEQMAAQATSVPTVFSEAFYAVQAEVQALYAKYMGDATSEAEIKAFVESLELGELHYILSERQSIVEYASNFGLSEYEAVALTEVEEKLVDFFNAVSEQYESLTTTRETKTLNGVQIISDYFDADYCNETQVGTDLEAGIMGGSKTATLIVKNPNDYPAVISFYYSHSPDKDCQAASYIEIDGLKLSGTETISATKYEKTFAAGESITINQFLQSPGGFSFSQARGQLILKDFTLTKVEGENVTFEYDESVASVTIDGATVDNEESVYVVATGAVLNATSTNSAFVAWVDGNGKILSTEASFTLYPTAGLIVQPLFTSSTDPDAYFLVDGTHLYSDLNVASEKGTKIVLYNNGTLRAGDYTIAAGDTLLIPMDAGYTVNTTVPVQVDGYATPSAFRTLTMAKGANIVVNGVLNVNGTQSASGSYTGSPTGAVGFINMNTGSNITINNGGALYAWGFVVGDGSVTANSGATVYQHFQVADWRGGNATTDMIDNEYRVFPMSQYYIQNIQVPLTLYAGAAEYGYMSVAVSVIGIQGSKVPFAGSDGMFVLQNGYVIQDFDESTGRLDIQLYGDVNMQNLSLSMKLSVLGEAAIHSQNYALPVNGSMTLRAMSGSMNVSQDIALHPGAEIYVGKDASFTLLNDTNIYVYALSDWGNYVGSGNATFKDYPYAYGTTGGVQNRQKDAQIQVEGSVDASAGYVYTTTGKANIYSTGTGKVITRAGSQTVTYQAQQGKAYGADEDNMIGAYPEIAITPAYLKNADGSYTETGVAPENLYTLSSAGEWIPVTSPDGTYVYDDGFWVLPCVGDTHVYTLTEEAATCTVPFTEVYACQCGDAETVRVESTLDMDGFKPLGHTYMRVETLPTCGTYTCGDCGVTETLTGDHTYNETENWTCGTRKCTVCGQDVAGDGNHYAEGFYTDEVTAPTCETAGSTLRTCACGETMTIEGEAALGHNFEQTEKVDRGCTTNGSVTYVCKNNADHTWTVTPDNYDEMPEELQDVMVAAGITVETLTAAHDFDVTTKAPTCTEPGQIVKTCSVCGETETETDPANPEKLGHDESGAAAATCTTPQVCVRVVDANGNTCGAVIEAAKGHTYGDGVRVEPGCVTDGTITFTCTACEASTDEYPNPFVVTYDMTVEELPASLQSVVDQTTIDNLKQTGHSHAKTTVDPTCLTNGYYYYKCTCGDSYKVEYVEGDTSEENLYLKATGHTYTVQDKADASCSAAGSITLVCGDCEDGTDRNTVVIGPETVYDDLHDDVKSVVDDNGAKIVTTDVIAGLAIQPHNYVVTASETRTCLKDGSITYNCSYCGNVEYKVHADSSFDALPEGIRTLLGSAEAIANLNAPGKHNYDVVVTAPTCTEGGYTTNTCTNDFCVDGENGGKYSYKSAETNATGHEYSNDAMTHTPGSCAGEGSVVYTCVNVNNEVTCGHVVTVTSASSALDADITALLEAAGITLESLARQKHSYGDWFEETPATCTAAGLKRRVCTNYDNCGDFDTEEISATGHSFAETSSVTATCTQEGSVTYTCANNCGTEHTVTYANYDTMPEEIQELVAKDTLKQPGHVSGSAQQTNATCLVDGKVEYFCKNCGNVYNTFTWESGEDYASLKATGHNYAVEEETNPNCTEDGQIVYSCNNANCDKDETATCTVTIEHADAELFAELPEQIQTVLGSADAVKEKLAATGHDYQRDATKDVAATCEAEGSITFVCSNNAEHVYVLKPSTYNNDAPEGITDVETLLASIKKLDHVYSITVSEDPTCLDNGSKTYVCQNGCDDEYVLDPDTYNADEVPAEITITPADVEELKAKGHAYALAAGSEMIATCTEYGTKTYICANDGCDGAKTIVVSPETMEYADLDASIQQILTQNDFDALRPTGHHYNGVESGATCQQPGTITYTCDNTWCEKNDAAYSYVVTINSDFNALPEQIQNELGSREEMIAKLTALGHKYPESDDEGWTVETAATCLTAGVEKRVCERDCGDYQTRGINAKGHAYAQAENGYTAATCTAEGSIVYTCANENCDGQKTVTVTLDMVYDELDASIKENLTEDAFNALAAKGHVYSQVDKVAPTCTTEGSITLTCKNCVEGTENNTVKITTDTKYEELSKEVKATVDENNNAVVTEQIIANLVATGHTYYVQNESAATCTAAGSITLACGACADGTNGKTYIITPDAIYDELPDDVKAAEYAEGVKVVTAESIAMLAIKGHTYTVASSIPATCTTDGSITLSCGKCVDGTANNTIVIGPETEYAALPNEAKTLKDAEGNAVVTEAIIKGLAMTNHPNKTYINVTEKPCTGYYEAAYDCLDCDMWSADGIVWTAERAYANGEHWYVKEEGEGTYTPATCTADAFTTYECQWGCGKTDIVIEKNTATNHEPKVWQDEETATCEKAGKQASWYCSDCDKYSLNGTDWTDERATIDQLDHAWSAATTAATCEADGWIVYTCSNGCDDSYKVTPDNYATISVPEGVSALIAQVTWTDLEAKGHAYTQQGSTNVTCTENGTITYTCSNEGCEEPTVVVNPAEMTYEAVDASMNLTEEAFNALKAKGHDYQQIANTAAGCVTEGSVTFKCQNICGDEYVIAPSTYENLAADLQALISKAELAALEATGHSYRDEDGNLIASEGKHTQYECLKPVITLYTCKQCEEGTAGHTYEDVGEVLQHKWEGTNQKDPTCTEPGEMAGSKCAYCGEKSENEVISALGHTYKKNGVYVEEPTEYQAATCEEAGYAVYTCTRCTEGTDGHTDEVVLPALEHSYNAVTTQPVCENDGYITYTCTRTGCGDTYTERPDDEGQENNETLQALQALNHREKTQHAEDPATCEDGGYETSWQCDICHKWSVDGEMWTDNRAAIAPTGHAWNGVTTDPACETEGYITYTCANNCGAAGYVVKPSNVDTLELPAEIVKLLESVDLTELNALEHDWAEATCDAPKTCKRESCGATEGDVRAHDIKTTVVAPICKTMTAGYTLDECQYTDCTYSRKYNWQQAAHTWNANAASCTTARYCTVCDTVDAAALGHNYYLEDGVTLDETKCTADVAATCEAAGYRVYTCSRCTATTEGHTLTVAGDPAIAHKNKEQKAEEAATCTETGLKASYYCPDCKLWSEDGVEWTKDRAVIEAIAHKNKEQKAEEAATCTETGLKASYYCPDCKLWSEDGVEWTKDRAVIEAIAHKNKEQKAEEAATCTETGLKASYYCPDCKLWSEDGEKWTEDRAVIEAIAHKNKEQKAEEAATCTETGLKASYYCPDCKLWSEDGEKWTDDRATIDALTHDWKAATCTEPKTCQREGCGATEGSKLGHSYTSEVTKEATCKEAGVRTYTCQVCDDQYTESIPKLLTHTPVQIPEVDATCDAPGSTAGEKCSVCDKVLTAPETVDQLKHVYAGKVTTPATCEVAGVMTYTCQNKGCKSSYTEPVEATGHTPVAMDEVNATCTDPGSTGGIKCSVCGNTLEAATVLPALNHSEVVDEAVAPTCTATGLTEGAHCSRCDEVLKAQTVVPANGHTYTKLEAKEATCTEAGWTEGEWCPVCKTVFTAQEPVPAKKHKNTITLEAKAPTCTETGLTAGVRCVDCGVDLTPQETVKALGHTWTAANCTMPKTCSVCGATEGAKLDHDWADATCTAPKTCKRENCGVTEGEALGHDWADATCNAAKTCKTCGVTEGEKLEHVVVTDEAVEATCTATGLTEGSHCDLCGEVFKEQTVVEKLAHTLVDDPRVEATCTNTGLTAGSHCSVCGYVEVAQSVINTKPHTVVPDKAVAATCTKTGLTEGSHCSVCGNVLVEQTVTEALKHIEIDDQGYAPTCTETGLTDGVHCDRCDEILKEQEAIPALNHDVKVDAAVAATCTETGLTEGSHCDRCSEVLVAQEITEALDHDWNDGVEEPKHTCTTAGTMTYTCTRVDCGETKTEEVMAQHTMVEAEAVPPTCTETGLTAGSYCSECDYVKVKQEIVAPAHAWIDVEIIKEATCTTDGSKDVICSVEGCGATATVVIPAMGHNVVIDPAKAATCTTDGITEGKHCSVCNEVFVAQIVIPAAHQWNKPPCENVGAVCKRCGLSNEEEYEHKLLPATCTDPATCSYKCGYTEGAPLGHTKVVIDEIPVTCHESGWTEGSECSVCGSVIDIPREIPSPGHNIVQHEAKRPTFTSVGWEAYEKCTRCNYTTYVEIASLGEQYIDSYEELITYLPMLEQWAVDYAKITPNVDPVNLVIKYIRTGVDRYNSGSWGIMAGYENPGFAKFVNEKEDEINAQHTKIEDMIQVSGLKNLKEFDLANGNHVDFGHMFGTMDITYHNKGSVNHADVGGWAGDLVDLLSTVDHDDHQDDLNAVVQGDLDKNFEAMVTFIRTELLGFDTGHGDDFAKNDIWGDLDAFYIMQTLDSANYVAGDLTKIFENYFVASLNDRQRADFLLAHRLDDVTTRSAIREAVYNAYTTNSVISTLEGTREFVNIKTTEELIIKRKAVCYAFADWLCIEAGDWVKDTDNPYLTDYEATYSMLAPGISMEIHKATSADGYNMVYYLGYADISRDDVHVMANYKTRNAESWGMSRVLDQAYAAKKYHSNPDDLENYIENFEPIIATNAAGFNMSTGEPSGLLVMNGKEYHMIDGQGFFGITKDGRAVIGSKADYENTYKGQLAEGVAGFGTMLVNNGELAITATSNYYSDRASRTAVGITASGRVVLMVLDGRQVPWSCGGSMIEIAQIMKLAGCQVAVNLDGGGSTTFVARQAGDTELSVVNRPSDGVQRSVSTSLLIASTAPSSTAFDRAIIESDYNFMTEGATVNVKATGLSATNNIVDLPEGTYWTVSNEERASVTEDGVVTTDPAYIPKDENDNTFIVSLMLDGNVLATKTLTVVVPDMLYFDREKIDGIYGKSTALPLKARYEGKSVAFTENDVAFELDTPKDKAPAGEMDGFNFVAVEESDIKTVKVTASLVANDAVTATITVILYKDGENNFDFENATGGSRQLAWKREVSNSTHEKTTDTYYVVNANEPMVTEYTVALDMSQIPIPKKLESLTYMLPGSDTPDASAWFFLLNLAQRISDMTEITATFTIDPNFDVDYSELSIINDYFVLNGTSFNEETNALTLTLNWKRATAAIDVATANPMCRVSGLKLTPKAGAEQTLKPVNKAFVSYVVYMRANALYTFANKPENQEAFDIFPYVDNREGPYKGESGGYFSDTYATFEDSYTLNRAMKNGWMIEAGGFRYYINNEYLVGIHKIDGLYYEFDEEGINIGQTPYTGLHVMDGYTYYMKNGELFNGWVMLGDDWYRFDGKTGRGKHGTVNEYSFTDEYGVTVTPVYEFENGKLLYGYWHQTSIGWRYYYGPYYYKQGWRQLPTQDAIKNRTDEKAMYFFEEYYVQNGVSPVQEAHAIYEYWYEFSETGELLNNYYANGSVPTGFYWWDDDWYKGVGKGKEPELYYVVYNLNDDGYSEAVQDGLRKIDGDYYYFDTYSGIAYRNCSRWITTTNDLLPAGTYKFGADGKIVMTNGVYNEDGTLYYYRNGMRTANAGLVEFEGHIYGVGSGAVCYVNRSAYISTPNGLAAGAGTYRFDENGHLIAAKAVVDESGTLYYYSPTGKRVADVGLVEFAGDIYYIGAYTLNGTTYNEKKAIAATNVEINVTKNKANGLLPAGTYRFGEDGKAILTTALVEGDDGKLYYYMNGALQKDAGLIKYEGAYYYIDKNGAAVTDAEVLVEKTIDPFPVDTYEFGSDGKMIIREGIYEGYYYVGGIKTAAGLIQVDGKYYYADEGGKIVTDAKYNVQKTNGLLTAGTYRINKDGTLNLTTELADENGTKVYYVNGLLTANAGLLKIGDDYYYIVEDGIAVANTKYNVTKTNKLLTAGYYRFDKDGKAIMTTELVDEAGKLAYYKNGRLTGGVGLLKLGEDYYYIGQAGYALTSQKITIRSGDLLPAGIYRIGADGKVILTTELVDESGHLTYYKNGNLTKNAGLIKLGDAYYYIDEFGYAVTNTKQNVQKTNGLLTAGYYRFGADGKAILNTMLVEEDGKLIYYKNGLLTKDAGLVYVNGAYYYIDETGAAVTDTEMRVEKTNDLLPVDTYRFGEDGKAILTTRLVEENGKLNYYVQGKLTKNVGLIEYEGDYYYIDEEGAAVTNALVDVTAGKANGLFPADTYKFGADGKMVIYDGVIVNGYYYEDGVKTAAGLVKVGEDFYYADEGGKIVTDITMMVKKTNGLLPEGEYTFGEDGKLILVKRMPGDADDDGKVDILDALLTLKHSVGWELEINLENANVDGNDQVNILDALTILKYSVGWDIELL